LEVPLSCIVSSHHEAEHSSTFDHGPLRQLPSRDFRRKINEAGKIDFVPLTVFILFSCCGDSIVW
jgi:hypothetical protein